MHFLHNGNEFGSIPMRHFITLQEKYDKAKLVFDKINYHKHRWLICVDSKLMNYLQEKQAEYMKHLRFLFYRDSRAKSQH